MTTPASGTFDVPPTQNTATVIEFRCLWTADSRRKQKRWQDGKLKFHTFNRRVMVYDSRSHFVGDTHWREATLDDGEELELERGGILVEVQDRLGVQNQDLTELIDKRVQDRVERVAAKHAEGSPLRLATSTSYTPAVPASYLRPKPLDSIIGTPSGHYGRAAVSTASPFEQRQTLNSGVRDENDTPRPTKKRKHDESPASKSGYAQSLMGTSLVFSSSRPSSTPVIRHEPLRLKSFQQPQPPIDLTMDDDNAGNGGMLSVGRQKETTKPKKLSARERMQQRRQESAQSGYASNLTGASLSLSRPSVPGLEGIRKTPAVTSPSIGEGRDTFQSSLSTDFGDLDTVMLPAVNPKIGDASKRTVLNASSRSEGENGLSGPGASVLPQSKSKLKPKHKAAVAKTKPASSTSPRVAERSRTALKIKPRARAQMMSTVGHEKIITDSPSGANPTEKPHTALKLKSRPRSQMMMLMDRPSSRASANTSFNSAVSSSTSERTTARFEKSATISPEQDLQNRDAEVSLEEAIDELDMYFLEDVGVNHQGVDSVISRGKTAGNTASSRTSPVRVTAPLRPDAGRIPRITKTTAESRPSADLALATARERSYVSGQAPEHVNRAVNDGTDSQSIGTGEQFPTAIFEWTPDASSLEANRPTTAVSLEGGHADAAVSIDAAKDVLLEESNRAASTSACTTLNLRPTPRSKPTLLVPSLPSASTQNPELADTFASENQDIGRNPTYLVAPAGQTRHDHSRITNPATRGSPLQSAILKAAVEATNPLLSMPAPLNNSLRKAALTVQRKASAAFNDLDIAEDPDCKGPWSPGESFDLFGKWRPPR